MSKPDIIEGKRYVYSHTDSIVVAGTIWHRDFYYALGEDIPLLRFNPTDERPPSEKQKPEPPHARRKTIRELINPYKP